MRKQVNSDRFVDCIDITGNRHDNDLDILLGLCASLPYQAVYSKHSDDTFLVSLITNIEDHEDDRIHDIFTDFGYQVYASQVHVDYINRHGTPLKTIYEVSKNKPVEG